MVPKVVNLVPNVVLRTSKSDNLAPKVAQMVPKATILSPHSMPTTRLWLLDVVRIQRAIIQVSPLQRVPRPSQRMSLCMNSFNDSTRCIAESDKPSTPAIQKGTRGSQVRSRK